MKKKVVSKNRSKLILMMVLLVTLGLGVLGLNRVLDDRGHAAGNMACGSSDGYKDPSNPDAWTPGCYTNYTVDGSCLPGYCCRINIPAVGVCVLKDSNGTGCGKNNGSCSGKCPSGQTCSEKNNKCLCVKPNCTPSCTKLCGQDNGCGGKCANGDKYVWNKCINGKQINKCGTTRSCKK